MLYGNLFGPVVSRRLGISLGVDVIPSKYCTMNCVYCEVGRTDHLLSEPFGSADADVINRELDDFLADRPKLDYITFSGSGEPLLFKDMDKVIEHVKLQYPEYKLALLTNGSLIGRKDIRKSLMKLDLVLPSLDAVGREAFVKVDRPHPSLDAKTILKDLVEFNREYTGTMWLEVFLVPGINDNDEELDRIGDAVAQIKPDKLQINSLDRPGTERWVEKESQAMLVHAVDIISVKADPSTSVEIIGKADSNKYNSNLESKDTESDIISALRRRPCTVDDLCRMFNIHHNEVHKVMHVLLSNGTVTTRAEERGIFYVLVSD